MKSIYTILFLALIALAAKAERPNIVLILADDLGYSDIRCFGGEIETPHLDQLAANGIRYTDFHNAARCCPTRASLLTGLYPHETGVGHMVYSDLGPGYRGHLNNKCTTMAQMLSHAGYQTMMSGKWHVGHQSKEVLPEQRGFNDFFGTYLHVDSYFKVLPNCDIWLNGEKQISGSWSEIPSHPDSSDREFYTTDLYTDYALKFLNQAYKETNPFFLYLAFNTPHWPLEAPERNVAKYRDRYQSGWDSLRREKFNRMKEQGILPTNAVLPESGNTKWSEVSPADQKELAFRRALYAGQVNNMDENIGRVIESLSKAKKLNNTLILFLSDNGCSAEQGMFGYRFEENKIANFPEWRSASGRSSSQGQAWAAASNAPYRQFKKDTYEGGSRTPLIAHWPEGITTESGTLNKTTGHIIDLMATLVDLAKGKLPTNAQGLSLKPTFSGEDIKRKSPLYWEHEGNRAIRVGNWKMVSTRANRKRQPWELYNLNNDPTELINVASDHQDLVRDLSSKWTTWAKASIVLPDIFERRAKKKQKP